MPHSGITEFHGQPSQRPPHCTLGSCVKPTGNFVECQSLLSFFLCAHKSLGRRTLCVSVGPEVFIPFLLTLCALTLLPLPSFPCVLPFFLTRETKVQRINIPWLVNGMLDPASRHWSPIFLGATAGKQPPMGTMKAPETF